MNQRREMSRAELVRLRREQEHAKQMQRAVKEATRPVPSLAERAKKPGKACARAEGK